MRAYGVSRFGGMPTVRESTRGERMPAHRLSAMVVDALGQVDDPFYGALRQGFDRRCWSSADEVREALACTLSVIYTLGFVDDSPGGREFFRIATAIVRGDDGYA